MIMLKKKDITLIAPRLKFVFRSFDFAIYNSNVSVIKDKTKPCNSDDFYEALGNLATKYKL